MKVCEKCGKEFEDYVIIDGIKRDLHKRKNCLDCSPFGQQSGGKKPAKENDYGKCLYCSKPLKVARRKYCDNHCEQEYLYQQYIEKWKNGEVSGTKGSKWVDVSDYIRRYIFEKYDNKCSICGWSEINTYTKTLPLEIEHIDGDAMNNKEENLTLLCPNCHSLTKTYRGANKGNGTRDIKWLSPSGTTYVS